MTTKNAPPRDRLLKTAEELFYQEGIRAVGINRILEESRTPIMSLYRNFGSKDGLAVAYLKRRSERFAKVFDDEVNRRASSPREKLLATFDTLCDLVAEPDYRGCAFINAAAEMASPDHELTKIARDHKDAGRKWLAGFAAEAGVQDPERLAIQLTLLIDGAFVAVDLYQDSSDAAFARAAAEVLVDAALAAGSSTAAAES